ncbi:type III secretion system cytoplasmic ring protein SctQ [Paracidovorax citrulli]|uniref:Type III secretion system cytoplasmic ring protein SctQ n=1 Tax=Paracidovorax citrulli TaxID=80869 RepID=A0ABY9AP56_PARCI|nr:type III secretion system cytoplasmic ring protein SctQ [Paracidovorax citrulli]PVY65238.1 type III secretion protein Q [Paracidovorax citrulli]REG70572.1 type III secretion protein Q [Paracidovorax citrulli]RLJ95124.1 type III secretion protein Q [Paracidovorax citrulli]UMT85204.1 YscQ/HrcQ family type III secretion apparatus protein [Paracidovorax citrulli]WIY29034.1 type III secretion system cytoplasmic ring protein SctQ [Paracidovorax citrulli]
MNALAPHSAITAELADRLPIVPPGEAHLARIAFDRRFARWAARLCSQPPGRVAAAAPGCHHDAVSLDFSCVHGHLQVSVPLSAWPTLGMAARLADAALAREVAETLIAAPLAAVAPVLPGLALTGVSVRTALQAPLEWTQGAMRIGLHAIDGGVADRLCAHLAHSAQADGEPLAALRLPGTVRLATRRLAPADLASLAAGDVVLCGTLSAGRRRLCHLSFGLGTTMHIPAELDLDDSEIALHAAPQADAFAEPADEDGAPDPAGAAEEAAPCSGSDAEPEATPLPLTDIGGIRVPVAIEIDTARIRLDELAALDAGAIVPLAVAARDATVRLVCHGQVVGTGRLVVIGDHLGVRIAHMAAAGAASPTATGAP